MTLYMDRTYNTTLPEKLTGDVIYVTSHIFQFEATKSLCHLQMSECMWPQYIEFSEICDIISRHGEFHLYKNKW